MFFRDKMCNIIWLHVHYFNVTCNFPEEMGSFFLSPNPAIVAKYWITRLVLTVFPAPDSPLKNIETCQIYSKSIMGKLRQFHQHTAYVIRMDWFSLSTKKIYEKTNNSHIMRVSQSLQKTAKLHTILFKHSGSPVSMNWQALSEMEKMCGGASWRFLPLYAHTTSWLYTGSHLYGLTVTQNKPEYVCNVVEEKTDLGNDFTLQFP